MPCPRAADAILVGYGLCGNIIKGLKAQHTPLVLPRAHDCITFFLGSKDRYQRMSETRVGTYYYTSGWLECLRRHRERGRPPTRCSCRRAGAGECDRSLRAVAQKYGEEQARYLWQTMDEWTQHYTHGALIDFDFTKPLHLDEQVKQICANADGSSRRCRATSVCFSAG
jgi:hypothetical protein